MPEVVPNLTHKVIRVNDCYTIRGWPGVVVASLNVMAMGYKVLCHQGGHWQNTSYQHIRIGLGSMWGPSRFAPYGRW